MSASDLRNTVLGLLRTIASKGEQLDYEARVRISVPTELDCGWFDDLYHPEASLFREAFNEAEQDRLADFHKVYAAHSAHLPMRLYDRLADPAWGQVMDAAQQALNGFRPDDGELNAELDRGHNGACNPNAGRQPRPVNDGPLGLQP